MQPISPLPLSAHPASPTHVACRTHLHTPRIFPFPAELPPYSQLERVTAGAASSPPGRRLGPCTPLPLSFERSWRRRIFAPSPFQCRAISCYSCIIRSCSSPVDHALHHSITLFTNRSRSSPIDHPSLPCTSASATARCLAHAHHSPPSHLHSHKPSQSPRTKMLAHLHGPSVMLARMHLLTPFLQGRLHRGARAS